MPSCDGIEAALRSSLNCSVSNAKSTSKKLDEDLSSTAKRVLLSKIEYRAGEKEYVSVLKGLQAKYITLNPQTVSNNNNNCNSNNIINNNNNATSTENCNSTCSRNLNSNMNGNSGNSSGMNSEGSLQASTDGIPTPKVVIHPQDNIKLGWLRVYKIGAGLANLGNTCFLNATLQCLTYTPPLVSHLIEFNEHTSSCKNVGFCMMCELQRHIRRALEKNGEIIRPQYILQKLKSIAAHMTWGRQEDAHEFLRYVMDSMVSSSLNGYSTAKLDRISHETTVVNQIFGGYHRSQILCLRCKEKSDTYDHFMDIMLDIKNAASLERAVDNFVQPEVLDNENAYMCPNCKQKCPAKKKFTIHRAPNIATFQLKRFDYSRSMGGKITKCVTFPEKLDLRPFMSQRQGPPIMYQLYAVLVHQGVSCNSGHYFCFVRNSNNLWYLMDDSKVRQVSLGVVLSQQAYLLFYTRIPNNVPLKGPFQPNHKYNCNLSAPSTSISNMNGNGGNPSNERPAVTILRKPGIVVPSTAINSKVKTNNMTAASAVAINSNIRDKITFDPCKAPSPDRGLQQKHPRIVMQIKHGKVYSCQPSWGTTQGHAITTNSSPLSTPRTNVELVPYPPDSSEESDMDTRANSPRVRPPPATATPVPVEPSKDHHQPVEEPPFLPSNPPSSPAADLNNLANPRKDDRVFPDGSLVVVTAPGPVKVNATTTPWLVKDSCQQSPSVASEGSNVSVNSTTDWTVTDREQCLKNDRQCHTGGWKVFPSAPAATVKVEGCAVNDGEDCTSGARVSRPQGDPASACPSSACGGNGGGGDSVKHQSSTSSLSSSSSSVSLKSQNSAEAVGSRRKSQSESRVSPARKRRSVDSSGGGKDEEDDGEQGADAGSGDRSRVTVNGHVSSVERDVDEGSGAAKKHKKRKKRKHESDLRRSHSHDESEDDHRRRKKRHKRKHSSSDDSEFGKSGERNGRRGRRTTNASGVATDTSSHSSGGGRGSSYELEWVERTKETLEQEHGRNWYPQVPFAAQSNCNAVVPAMGVKVWDQGLRDGTRQTSYFGNQHYQQHQSYHCGKQPENHEVNGGYPVGRTNAAFGMRRMNPVNELAATSSRGYGNNVTAWSGGHNYLDRDLERDANTRRRNDNSYEYDMEYDRGKTKKLKYHKRYPDSGYGMNPFQKFQNFRNDGGHLHGNRWNPTHRPYNRRRQTGHVHFYHNNKSKY